MPTRITDSRLAALAAGAIHEGFDAYRHRFDQVTRRARARFESRDWRGLQTDAALRLDLYREHVDEVVVRVRAMMGARVEEKLLWAMMKAVFSGLIASRDDWDLAETFFNSAPPKRTTAEAVRAAYRLVFKHDRAGRLVDAQEFEHLRFDRRRFTDRLLEELERLASHRVTIDDEHVVFYDYDELTLLTQCRFRAMPPAACYEDELSASPWFSVGEDDVFPEELSRFLGLPPHLRAAFDQHHLDLFDVGWWRGIQARIEAGEITDPLPYRPRNRWPRPA